MENEIIWIGNIVRVGSKTPRYLYNESKYSIEFRTLKDKKEIGYLNKDKSILYLNGDYRMQYKAIKRQIIKDYAPKSVSEYLNIRGGF